MRLVSNVSRRRDWHRSKHLAVVGRPLIEVDHGEKVGSDMSLIARPHIERRRLFVMSAMAVGCVIAIEVGGRGDGLSTVGDATVLDRSHAPCSTRQPTSAIPARRNPADACHMKNLQRGSGEETATLLIASSAASNGHCSHGARVTRDEHQPVDELVARHYEELRRLAHRHLRRERSDATLETTGLVNEAYLRFAESRRNWCRTRRRASSRSPPPRCVAVLVDMHEAGAQNAAKRPSVFRWRTSSWCSSDDEADELVALDEALTRLEQINPRGNEVVQYRFFGGLTLEETADDPRRVRQDSSA